MTTTPKAGDPVEVVPAVINAAHIGVTMVAGSIPTAASAAVLPTQLRHPWKATARSAVAFVIGAAPLAPEIYHQATQNDPAQATGAAFIALAIAGAVTRVMATPTVEALLRRFKATRWLAAAAAPRE